MFLNSIRWRLQVWYGVILIAVLAGFGITAYQLERAQRFRTIDGELKRRMDALLPVLQLNAPGRDGPDEDFRDRPPPPEDPLREGPGEGPRRKPPRPDEFKVPPQIAGLFGSGPDAYYFMIRERDGTLMGRSANAPTKEKSEPLDSYRELRQTTPPGDSLVVGRMVAPDLAQLHQFAWSLAGFGFMVLLGGLAGGWALGTRAIRPIEAISSTAVKIAAGDLSLRIDVADTENELGRLAGVLNSTFARLEAAFAQQGQFTADAAHELRTPVSVILTQTQTALKHDRNAGDYRQTVEACQRSAQKMRRLLESLLELARLDAGQEPMKRLRFDLANTVRDSIESVQPLASERDIKIKSELTALESVGDPERLGQVITNLLSNAIHYNKDRGEVRVSVQQQNGNALVVVADTGQGISAGDLPHVFERFYRADKARTNAAGHTGLGLAISKAIVEAHGGNIEVTSQSGVGTTFTVRLPNPS